MVFTPLLYADDLKKNRVMMVGSYLGTSDFCFSYGIDYKNIAYKIIKSLDKEFEQANSNYLEVFRKAVSKGKIGFLFSPEAKGFINLAQENVNPFQLCKITHQEVIKLSLAK